MENKQMNELMERLFYESSEAIFFFNRHNQLINMNPAAEEILDPYVKENLLAKVDKGFCLTCRGFTNEKEEMTCEGCFMGNPNQDFTSFQVFLDTRGKGVIPYIATYQIIDKQRGIKVFMLRNLTRHNQVKESFYKSNLMQRTINAQENERKRISRELHDSIAQELISSLVELRVLKYMDISTEIRDKIVEAEASLNRLLEEVRNLSLELRPALLDDLGLEAAFRTHFKWIEKNYGLLVHFNSEMQGARFNSEIETVVYRICQEAVFNALKYARVDEVKIRLFLTKDNLELIVEDEGIGFNIDAKEAQGTGLGLFGMHERAELVGANLSIQSVIGKGTIIHLAIPLSKKVSKEWSTI